MKRIYLWVLLVLLALPVGSLLYEYLSVGRPVARMLADDPRNEVVPVSVDLVGLGTSRLRVDLDSEEVGQASGADMWRVLFQTAEHFHDQDRRFDAVHLARDGESVFVLDGQDFADLGEQFDYGENPIYMIRTLPQKLYRPDGSPAFETWTGGWLGVLGAQMEDTNEAAMEWAIRP